MAKYTPITLTCLFLPEAWRNRQLPTTLQTNSGTARLGEGSWAMLVDTG